MAASRTRGLLCKHGILGRVCFSTWLSRRALGENRIVDLTSLINFTVVVSYGPDEIITY